MSLTEMQKLGSFLGAKFNKVVELLNGKADGVHVHEVATGETNGFMSKEDKVKIDGIGTYEEMVASFNATVGEASPFYRSL